MLKYSYDASGNMASQTMENVSLPQIAGQPVRQVVEPGEVATFSVVVSDANGVTFQWKFNGTDIPGATSDSLLLINVSAANEGSYSVVVTNSAGSVTSASVALMLDTDRDGLPDSWEIANFGNLTSQRSEGDPDRDGISNLDEFLDSTNPNSNASLRPRLTAYSDVGGSVTVTPMKLSYDLGEVITLTATPAAPSVFIGWAGDLNTGDLLSTTNPVTFAINGNTTVRARFASAVPLPPGLVALWRGETDASDPIGGHDGTFFAGSSATAPSVTPWGKVGGAFSFDGTVYIRVLDSAALRPAEITVEAWVFSTLQSGDHQSVIGRGSSGNDDDAWWLGILNGKPRFWSNHVGSGMVVLEAPSAIPLNQWTHLAISFDGTKRLYVNGVQVASQSGLGALVYDAAAVPVTIGSDLTKNETSARFNGKVDGLAIYNRALTLNEVADIYNADFVGKNLSQPYFTSPSQLPAVALDASYTQQLTTILGKLPVSFSLSAGALPPGMTISSDGVVSGVPSTPGVFDFTVRVTDAAGLFTEQTFTLQVIESVPAPAGLVGWWKAEGNALDSVGTNHGALRNGAGFAAGQVGQAFSLNGTGACIEIPDAPALRPVSLTLELWVSFDVTSGIIVVFAKPVGTGTSDSYALWLQNGTLNCVVGDTGGLGPILSAPFAPVPGRWYHVGYTFDDSAKQQALYIDGAQVAVGAASKPVGYDAQPLLLGRDTENGAPNFFLQGRIDEAAIYNRALSQAEIASIFNAGPAGKRL